MNSEPSPETKNSHKDLKYIKLVEKLKIHKLNLHKSTQNGTYLKFEI